MLHSHLSLMSSICVPFCSHFMQTDSFWGVLGSSHILQSSELAPHTTSSRSG